MMVFLNDSKLTPEKIRGFIMKAIAITKKSSPWFALHAPGITTN